MLPKVSALSRLRSSSVAVISGTCRGQMEDVEGQTHVRWVA
jgi:hypothetical protein